MKLKEEKLPKGWQLKKLEELLNFYIGGDWGKNEDYKDEKFDFAFCIRGSEIKNWSKNKGQTASLRKIKKTSIEKRKLQEGDILVEISGGGPEQPVGRTVLIDKAVLTYKPEIPKICTNFFRLIRPSNEINPTFLNWSLNKFYNSGEIGNYQGGSNNLRNLKFPEYLKIEIPLPTFPIQQAIVVKIEELLSELENGKKQLLTAQQQLKIYRQSLMKWAFEGKLTNKNVKEGELPKGWKCLKLGEICKIIGGVTKGKDYKDQQTISLPYLRVANVQDGYLNLNLIKTIEVIPAYLEKYRLVYGDILYTEGGDKDKLGRGTIWKNDVDNCIHQNHIFRARPNTEDYNSKYIAYFSQTTLAKQYFFKHGKQTTNLASINLRVLSGLPIPICNTKEQNLIVSKLETKLAVCDKIEKTISQSLVQAETLKQSILKKAFEGRLV